MSVGAKEGLYQYTRRVGVASGNTLLTASAWHHRSDALSSVVAVVGAGGATLGMPYLDPIAGFVVSALIGRVGASALYDAVQELLDAEQVLSACFKTTTPFCFVTACLLLPARPPMGGIMPPLPTSRPITRIPPSPRALAAPNRPLKR